MLIDSHCHLDAPEFDADRRQVRAAAHDRGVEIIIVPAVERGNFAAVAKVCRALPGCAAAFGIHPLAAARATEDDLAALRQTLVRENAVAVGEIGLDFFFAATDRARQQWCLAEQLKIARDLGLPVLLHVRRAVDAVLRELARIAPPGGIAHAFNGSMEQARRFLEMGFKLGFGGAMTHPRATRLRRLARELPLEALALETDAPDIPPAWLGRGRNSPAELPRIADELASLRGLRPAELAQATSANVRAVVPRLPSFPVAAGGTGAA